MCSAYRFLYLAALIFCASPALSAVTVEAVRVGSAYSGPSNQKLFDATLKTTSTTPGVPAKYVTRAVPLTAASAARLARGALGGPLGLAVTAALIADGLIFDNDTGEIVEPGIEYDGDLVYTCSVCSGWHVSPVSACQTAVWGQGTCPGTAPANNNTVCRVQRNISGDCTSSYSNFGISTAPNSGQADTPGLPASPERVEQAIPDDVFRDLINDLLRRRPQNIPTVIPELASEMEATKDAQQAAESHAADPSQNPAPTPEEQEIVDSQTTTEPTFATEFPAFCSWASVVCDFIDWMRAEPELPEHPPIPMLDIDIPDYDSNLPSVASCPAPVVVNTQMWGSFELSYQPFCDLAEYIRYGVLGIAYLFAAYTIIGVRR